MSSEPCLQTGPFLAAAVQMCSTADVDANLSTAEALVRKAVQRGARLVALPEHFGYLTAEGQPTPHAQPIEGPWISRFSQLARELHITLVAGTVSEVIANDSLPFNTSVVLGPDGQSLGHYRKIHLFDPNLPELGHLRESRTTRPGTRPSTVATPCGPLGLAICYDLRFPELFRVLVRDGALVFVTPSAFTSRTGPDHWEVLLRCRAIENLSYVIAPAQWGSHGPDRASHGHSMIVSPWGRVLDCLPEGQGFALAEIDLQNLHETRRRLPCLDHAHSHAHLTPAAGKHLTDKPKVG